LSANKAYYVLAFTTGHDLELDMYFTQNLRSLIGIVLFTLATPGCLQAAVVLQYHHISDTTPASTSTSPERFGMHLAYLEKHDFDVVPLEQLVQILRSGQPLPDRSVAITFDDGYSSIHDTAYPMLKSRGWPFTVFVNSEPHDRRQPSFMSWEQLREMRRNGGTIANHTVSHPYLLAHEEGLDEAAWRGWVADEITAAQSRIEAETGSTVKLLAYPFGEYDEAVLEVAQKLGFVGFGQQSGPLAEHSDLRVLPRFPFGGSYGDESDFATKVNSLPMPLAAGPDAISLESEGGEPLPDMVFNESGVRPILGLKFTEDFDTARVNCFVSGQGRTQPRTEGTWVYVRAEKGLGQGRSRYNCTAPSGQAGRFFWYSQLWIVRPAH
jgi:peptidoglycan/xylan/chitin deacetylase (PgdA/CDA1 family)